MHTHYNFLLVFQDDLDSFSLIRDVGCPGNILQSYLGLTESECASSCLQTAGCMAISWQENPPHVCDVKSLCAPFSVRASTDIYIRTEGRKMSVTLRVSELRLVCAPVLISTLGQKVGKCLYSIRYILVCDVNSVCGHGRTIHLASVTLRVSVLRSLCAPVLISTLGQKVGRPILVCDVKSVCGHGRRIHLASVTLRVSVLLSVWAPFLLSTSGQNVGIMHHCDVKSVCDA